MNSDNGSVVLRLELNWPDYFRIKPELDTNWFIVALVVMVCTVVGVGIGLLCGYFWGRSQSNGIKC